MKFSVLLSVYYSESPSYLKDALQSVFNQTLKPNEVVLVQDGPLTSELLAVIDEFRSKNKGVFSTYPIQQNVGLGKALNYGLSKCKHNIVLRMDTDDIATPDRFEIQVEEFVKNSELAICSSTVEEFNEIPFDLDRRRNLPLSHNEIESFSKLRNPFNHMAVAFRKNIIEDCGGYIDMPGYEDYYLWLRVINKRFETKNISKPLVHARVGNDMIGRRHGIIFLKNEMNFQYRCLQENIFNEFVFLRNIILRGLPRLFPKKGLSIVYNRILRA